MSTRFECFIWKLKKHVYPKSKKCQENKKRPHVFYKFSVCYFVIFIVFVVFCCKCFLFVKLLFWSLRCFLYIRIFCLATGYFVAFIVLYKAYLFIKVLFWCFRCLLEGVFVYKFVNDMFSYFLNKRCCL